MAHDIYHDTVKQALLKDGWTITHDPYAISFGIHNLYVDLGAEKLLAAEKSGQQIAIEIKSFISRSVVSDLENALGQFMLYRSLLQRRDPARIIYLAIPSATYNNLFATLLGQVVQEDFSLKLIVFDPDQEVIERWIE